MKRDIRFLVTDPSGEFILTRFGEGDALVLPGGESASWSDDAAPFVEGARALLGGDVPVLRVIPLDPDHDSASEWLVELEPTERSRRGHRWVPRGELDPARVDPPAARAPLDRWLAELAGVRSARRPPWSHPGWFDRTSDWMVKRLTGIGVDPEPPTLHQLWGISAILRAETPSGAFFAKQPAPIFHAEAALTETIASVVNELVPDVVATDETTGLLLMRDFGGRTLEDQPVERWAAGLEVLARIQLAFLDRLDLLSSSGAPQRGPMETAAFVARLAPGDATMIGLTADERKRFRGAIPAIVEVCRRLESLVPLRTIVHGDFHAGNVVETNEGCRVFDWTDAVIGHPFVDLTTLLGRVGDPSVRRELRDAYLDSWSGLAPREALIEAADLALVVGAFLQVEGYQRIAASFDPDDMWDLADAAPGWLRQGLRHLDDGIDAADEHLD